MFYQNKKTFFQCIRRFIQIISQTRKELNTNVIFVDISNSIGIKENKQPNRVAEEATKITTTILFTL